jgi:Tat protein translocase TatB subunit
MFNLGFTEMLMIAIIALVVIGPKQLPQVARVIGRMMGEFRRATSDFHREMYNAQDSINHQVRNMEEKLDVNSLLHDEPESKELGKKEDEVKSTHGS